MILQETPLMYHRFLQRLPPPSRGRTSAAECRVRGVHLPPTGWSLQTAKGLGRRNRVDLNSLFGEIWLCHMFDMVIHANMMWWWCDVIIIYYNYRSLCWMTLVEELIGHLLAVTSSFFCKTDVYVIIWGEYNITGLAEVFWKQAIQDYPWRSEHVLFS